MASMLGSCVLVATYTALLVLWSRTSLYVEGVEFFFDDVTTNGPVSVTDIGIMGTGIDTALICQSEAIGPATGTRDWYIHAENETTAVSDVIGPNGDGGWGRTRETTPDGYQQVILWRLPAPQTAALEGRFTCQVNVSGDSNPIRSLFVLYPISSVAASIVVVSARAGEFRVQCSSTGGRALSMTVTGPGGYNSDLTDNIQPVGTQNQTGSDEYSATTSDILTGGSDGDQYECIATSSTSNTDSVQLRVASAPTIESLERIAPDAVRVMWSGPTGGAPVTGYIIHYTESGGSVWTGTAGAGSTSTDITSLTDGETYTISVEARSEHLSGESEEMTTTLEPPPAAPVGLMLASVDSTSVNVSWEAVAGADRYTVTFTRATGPDQEGQCASNSHFASVSVDAPASTASIDIGEDVKLTVTDMLRAYSTYFITVMAVSNAGGSSEESGQISIFTPQTGAAIPPCCVIATVDSSTKISVQWGNTLEGLCRARNGVITSYRIQYTSRQPDAMVQTNQTEALEITLTELSPFTIYSIEVAAVNEEGDVGVYSERQYVVTEEDVPGPVSAISSVPSFLMITITWEEPEMPNGIITKYEVVYGPRDSPQSSRTENVTTGTTFTTPDDLERGTEYTFTVTAHTSVGPGDSTSIIVFTLNRPPAVEGVTVDSLNGTSVNVSWDTLVIPGHPIDNYTVVYSPVSQRRKRQEEEEEEMVFPGTVTSAVITGLDSSFNYQFQVFATAIVDGQALEGERSSAEATERDTDCESSVSSSSPIITGVIIGIIGVLIGAVVGVSGLIAAVVMCRRMRASAVSVSKGEGEVNTVDNLAYIYSLSGSCDESQGDYEMPVIVQSSPPPAAPAQEIVSVSGGEGEVNTEDNLAYSLSTSGPCDESQEDCVIMQSSLPADPAQEILYERVY